MKNETAPAGVRYFAPLPTPTWVERKGLIFDPSDPDITISAYRPLFTAQQMRDYVAADRAQRQAEQEPIAHIKARTSVSRALSWEVCSQDDGNAVPVYAAQPAGAEVLALMAKHKAQDAEIAALKAERDNWKETCIMYNTKYSEGAVEIAALKAEYRHACGLVADMHMAAMGGVVGPVLGVVEDVAALRQDALRYRRIRNGPHSDNYGDLYAMTFQGDGDIPVKGQDLDRVVDAAIAQAVQPTTKEKP